jgi:hypothetical protein
MKIALLRSRIASLFIVTLFAPLLAAADARLETAEGGDRGVSTSWLRKRNGNSEGGNALTQRSR